MKINKIIVFGSTGQTGLSAIETALKKGLNVRAFIRSTSKVPKSWQSKVETVLGNVLQYDTVKKAMEDVDRVVVALGTGTDLNPTTDLSEGMKNIIKAMEECRINVVSVTLSSYVFDEPDEFPQQFVHLNAEHRRMLKELQNSDLNYIAVFPPRIAGAANMMMPGRMGISPAAQENPLGLSWHDSTWIPILNTSNVMDYFSERSNPFFDRTCNNEIVKMQRLNPEQLNNMTGIEYILLHVQEPILYVIRKQFRHSPTQATPQADYYIIAGVVYQAPDLASVINSRLLSAVHHLQSSFEEASSFSRYHPSKGYSWDFKTQRSSTEKTTKPKEVEKPREEPSSVFQRQRVDMLLGELVRKFPIVAHQQKVATPAPSIKTEPESTPVPEKEIKTEIKQEKGMKPPPEKKMKPN